MRRIFDCSPFASPDPRVRREYVALVNAVCPEIALSGDAPLAPHLLLPRFLRDDHPTERDLGIRCGLSWLPVADEVWVYGDASEGVGREIVEARRMGIAVRRQP